MPVKLIFTTGDETFKTLEQATTRVAGLALIDGKLTDGTSELIGMDHPAIAYWCGELIQGTPKRAARAAFDDMFNNDLTLLELQYKQGIVKDSQLDSAQISRIKTKIGKE